MQIPITQRVIDDLEKNDAFLHAFLGVIGSIPQFDLLLARLAKPSLSPPLEEATVLGPIEVLLGAIAVRQRVGALLESAGFKAPLPGPARAESKPNRAEGLLR